MRILYFTNSDKINVTDITDILESHGHTIVRWCERVTLTCIEQCNIDFIVSDRPRTLIGIDVIERLPGRIINLHPAFLPWNRGYHPLYFSVRDGNPSGNTIHYIDEGIDTGDIIRREQVSFSSTDTLRTAYDKLRLSMVKMFAATWADIEAGRNDRMPQQGPYTHYWKKDFDGVLESLPKGWDTALTYVRGCDVKAV